VAQSLRIFYRFCTAHKVELALRATEGCCLTDDEAKKLGELCYRPLPEIEAMGDRKVIFLTSPKAGKAPKDLPDAVEPNTCKKRLNHIALYLDSYLEVFLEPNIRSFTTRSQLKLEYEKISHKLRKTIKGTKQNHHLSIKSLPTDKYLAIIKAGFIRPEELFQSQAGKSSRTLLRDRAMMLLACEGLRPGTIGNIALADFRPNSGHLVIKDNRAKRSERVTTGTPKLKMGDSTQVNSASETMITLWPFTVHAIQDYIDSERDAVLAKRLTNRSNGFLFLSDEGEPIKHRSSITQMFNNLGKRLTSLGLLDIGNDPYFADQKKYDFYGYVLRHSAASFFLAEKCKEHAEEEGVKRTSQYKDVPEMIKDLMKKRFGWTTNSKMPELYAARALSDYANVVLKEFNQSLLDAVQVQKQKRGAVRGV
jgi:integrase